MVCIKTSGLDLCTLKIPGYFGGSCEMQDTIISTRRGEQMALSRADARGAARDSSAHDGSGRWPSESSLRSSEVRTSYRTSPPPPCQRRIDGTWPRTPPSRRAAKTCSASGSVRSSSSALSRDSRQSCSARAPRARPASQRACVSAVPCPVAASRSAPSARHPDTRPRRPSRRVRACCSGARRRTPWPQPRCGGLRARRRRKHGACIAQRAAGRLYAVRRTTTASAIRVRVCVPVVYKQPSGPRMTPSVRVLLMSM